MQISKAGVLDDAIKRKLTLYPEGNNKIDHEAVIKYVLFISDSKRALDEYSSSIFMNGTIRKIEFDFHYSVLNSLYI